MFRLALTLFKRVQSLLSFLEQLICCLGFGFLLFSFSFNRFNFILYLSDFLLSLNPSLICLIKAFNGGIDLYLRDLFDLSSLCLDFFELLLYFFGFSFFSFSLFGGTLCFSLNLIDDLLFAFKKRALVHFAVDPDEVRHVADLARVDLDDEEVAEFTAQFGDILAYFEALDEVPEVESEPDLVNVMRADEERDCLDREQALRNAPETVDGYFKGPRVS